MSERMFFDDPALRDRSAAAAARQRIANHVHFRGRVDRFVFRVEADELIVEGTVPSFYLKQLLQTVLRDLPDVTRVVNRVEVVCAGGLSMCSQKTRERCALEYFWLGKRPECVPTCDRSPGQFEGDELMHAHVCVVAEQAQDASFPVVESQDGSASKDGAWLRSRV